jgi:RNA polymerase sigma-70 factor (ECF subfamily)
MMFAARSEKESMMIANILAGRRHLYHELIRPYERSVYIMILSRSRNEKQAAVLAQETFIRAFHELRTLPSDSHFGTWLLRIAREEADKRSLRWTIEQAACADESQEEEAQAPPAVLQDCPELPSEKARHLLQRAVKQLPVVCQRVLFLCDVEAIDKREVAQMLDINVWSVNARLHQARMMLQRVLAANLNETNGELEHSKEK